MNLFLLFTLSLNLKWTIHIISIIHHNLITALLQSSLAIDSNPTAIVLLRNALLAISTFAFTFHSDEFSFISRIMIIIVMISSVHQHFIIACLLFNAEFYWFRLQLAKRRLLINVVYHFHHVLFIITHLFIICLMI